MFKISLIILWLATGINIYSVILHFIGIKRIKNYKKKWRDGLLEEVNVCMKDYIENPDGDKWVRNDDNRTRATSTIN